MRIRTTLFYLDRSRWLPRRTDIEEFSSTLPAIAVDMFPTDDADCVPPIHFSMQTTHDVETESPKPENQNCELVE